MFFLVIVIYFILIKAKKNPYEKVSLLFNQADYKQEIEILDEQFQKDKLNPHVNYYLSLAYSKMKNFENAYIHLSNVISYDIFDSKIDEYTARKTFGLICYKLEKYNDTYHQFQKLYKNNPDDLEINA